MIENDYNNYFINSNIVGIREGGRFNRSKILKCEDGSEWVYLSNKPEERFCGYLYLQNALKEQNLVLPAENKMAIYNREIIYLSKYCGEKRPAPLENAAKYTALRNVGFTNCTAACNVREVGDTMYVFDTEKLSFNEKVHKKIDSYLEMHNSIKSILTETMNKQ